MNGTVYVTLNTTISNFAYGDLIFKNLILGFQVVILKFVHTTQAGMGDLYQLLLLDLTVVKDWKFSSFSPQKSSQLLIIFEPATNCKIRLHNFILCILHRYFSSLSFKNSTKFILLHNLHLQSMMYVSRFSSDETYIGRRRGHVFIDYDVGSPIILS